MIKRYYFTLTIALLSLMCSAQQWIDKQYSYDSVLNVEYGQAVNFNGDTDTLHMDIYMPQCSDSSYSEWPLLVFFHGGAFLAGDKNDASIQAMCKDFAKRGYVTASVDYRLGYVSDEIAHSCNYPNYTCIFATDSAEWYRAYYRATQDAKGAVRYLVNNHEEYHIDTSNVFVAGESAGAFLALAVGLLDDPSERPPYTGAISSAPQPHSSTSTCVYNQGKQFSGAVTRPDLGPIDGTMNPSTTQFTIKGIGNMYGGMFMNLLMVSDSTKAKPAIFSYHQPCDLVVPIDSNSIFWGNTWCLTNGYGCFGISNTPKIYGSRVISNWNSNNTYVIQNQFSSKTFPFSYLIGTGSCADQINNPCHAYDNKVLRQTQMATFFAGLVTSSRICDTSTASQRLLSSESVKLYPNPGQGVIHIMLNQPFTGTLVVYDSKGTEIKQMNMNQMRSASLEMDQAHGLYIIVLHSDSGETLRYRWVSF